jgi:phage baseplate assembly protein W
MAFRRTLYRGYSTIGVKSSRRLYDIELVKQDLLNHFNTRKNERFRDAAYGSIIPDLLFEHKTAANTNEIVTEVIRIVKTDNRVILTNVNILDDGDYGITVDCTLLYVGLDVPFDFRVKFDRDTGIAATENEG